MERKYHIFGVSNEHGDVLLHEEYTEQAARRWVDDYVKSGDFGGHDAIRVDFYGEEENFPVYIVCYEDVNTVETAKYRIEEVTGGAMVVDKNGNGPASYIGGPVNWTLIARISAKRFNTICRKSIEAGKWNYE